MQPKQKLSTEPTHPTQSFERRILRWREHVARAIYYRALNLAALMRLSSV